MHASYLACNLLQARAVHGLESTISFLEQQVEDGETYMLSVLQHLIVHSKIGIHLQVPDANIVLAQ